MKKPLDSLFEIQIHLENSAKIFKALVEGTTNLKTIANQLSNHLGYDYITTAYKFYVSTNRPVKKTCIKGRCKCTKARGGLGEENQWEIELKKSMREIWIERFGGEGFKGGTYISLLFS